MLKKSQALTPPPLGGRANKKRAFVAASLRSDVNKERIKLTKIQLDTQKKYINNYRQTNIQTERRIEKKRKSAICQKQF